MPAIQLAYRDLRVRVQSPEAADLAWLEEFLSPAFARVDDPRADAEVVVRHDDGTGVAALRADADGRTEPATALVLDTELQRFPTWRDRARRVLLHEEAHAFIVSDDGRHVQLVSAASRESRRTALMKLVRELAMSAAWTPRSLVLHAAAVAIGERALLIAGPKRAGKTSLLLHALGGAGAQLLANDRVVLERADGRAVAHGMPTIVNLRADTVLARFAGDDARRAVYRYRFFHTIAEAEQHPPATDLTPRPLACSPAQLGHLFGVELIGHASAAALLLPRVDSEAKGIELRRLDADEAAHRLPDVLFAAAQLPPPISDVFALPGAAPAASAAALHELWRAFVAPLPVFDCRLGGDAYTTDPSELVARVLD